MSGFMMMTSYEQLHVVLTLSALVLIVTIQLVRVYAYRRESVRVEMVRTPRGVLGPASILYVSGGKCPTCSNTTRVGRFCSRCGAEQSRGTISAGPQ